MECWTKASGKAACTKFFEEHVDGTPGAYQDSEHFRGIDVERVRADRVPLDVVRARASSAHAASRAATEAAARYDLMLRRRGER